MGYRKDTLQSQRHQLEDLDAKLRETDEKLKQLEATRHRHDQTSTMPPRKPVSSLIPGDSDADYSSGDSDGQGKSSPPREAHSR
ncbi:hypothetical protein A1O1_06697 [Capronia coronata CBS 617.96]|uniref:Uncharacterized protein n=1 Tax=Capronia coronata CBS 617.96 TaxID=1182541 RepID=W9YLC7_9EURO|nr:uncharacterized protein A1O1_06697 [Capronia coronata CBS 617.96]EXJ83079.1 hypothetical protein A1O1_06697 [Capronia coronata CBS 617.96]